MTYIATAHWTQDVELKLGIGTFSSGEQDRTIRLPRRKADHLLFRMLSARSIDHTTHFANKYRSKPHASVRGSAVEWALVIPAETKTPKSYGVSSFKSGRERIQRHHVKCCFNGNQSLVPCASVMPTSHAPLGF